MNARAASAGGAKTSTAKKDRTNDMGLVTPASVDRGLPLNLEKRPPTNLVGIVRLNRLEPGRCIP